MMNTRHVAIEMRIVVALGTILGSAAFAPAWTIRLNEPAQALPVEIHHDPTGSDPLEFKLLLANDSDEVAESLVSWQVALTMGGTDNSIGEIPFSSMEAPFGSIFPEGTGPQLLSELPSTTFASADVDISEDGDGVSFDPGYAFSIVTVRLAPSPDASGTFDLWMMPFDENDPDHSSFWILAADENAEKQFELRPFSNQVVNPPLLKLAVIRLEAAPIELDGDFNCDLVVDAADYTVWRDGLGANFGPDDYGIWKSHFGDSADGVTGSSVPEPASCGIALALAPFGLARRGRRRKWTGQIGV